MLVLEFLPARHGDCILVRWGAPDHMMVVDGGPDGVYEQTLRPRLIALASAQAPAPVVDVLCVSHIDDDHVAGVIRLLRELTQAKRDQLPLPIGLRRVWFKSVDELIDGVQPGLAASVRALVGSAPSNKSVAASYGQGRDVRSGIAALSLDGNQPFGGTLTTGANTLLHGLEVTVVGPSAASMAQLVKRWRAAVAKQQVKAVTAAFTDRAVPNLSSIALYLRHGGRTALLTGDARGDHLLSGLEAAGLLAPEGTIHLDVLKLPHHGSRNNAEPALFERIRADHYVVCADGIKHKHPNTETLEWLVASRDLDDTYTVHLTNSIPAAEAGLAALAVGRAFSVSVGAPRIEIELADAS